MLRPVTVKPLDNYILYLEFSNGEKKLFDVKPYLEHPFFRSLKDVTTFRQVFVNEITVEWANGRDIAPHELYDDSVPVENSPFTHPAA